MTLKIGKYPTINMYLPGKRNLMLKYERFQIHVYMVIQHKKMESNFFKNSRFITYNFNMST